VIEKFQSPFNSAGVLDGDKKKLVAPLMVLVAIESFWLSLKACLSHLFLKALVECFPKTCDVPHFLVIEKIQSPSNKLQLLDYDGLFFITIALMTKKFQSL
jgi:hypothetical protein